GRDEQEQREGSDGNKIGSGRWALGRRNDAAPSNSSAAPVALRPLHLVPYASYAFLPGCSAVFGCGNFPSCARRQTCVRAAGRAECAFDEQYESDLRNFPER